MKIVMLTHLSGDGYTLSPGDETDRFSADECRRLIDRRFAKPADGSVLETTVRSEEDRETRPSKPTGRKPRRGRRSR